MAKYISSDAADGAAALSICESLLIVLTERQIITDEEARGLLTDVVSAHQDAVSASDTPSEHLAVIAIVKRILAGKNGVRH